MKPPKRLRLQAAAVAVSLILSLFTAKAATVFQDNFETQTVGIPPVTAPIGTYTSGSLSASVTNAAAPGAYGGTNYVLLKRTTVASERADKLNAEFTAAANTNDVVHVEAWILWSSGYIQLDLETTSDAGVRSLGMFAILLGPGGTVKVYNANSVYVDSGFTFTPDQWSKYELDYKVGTDQITLTVDGASAVMSVSPLGKVTGALFGSGGPDSTAYVDDVLARIRPPATGTTVFSDNFETATLGSKPATPQVGIYHGTGVPAKATDAADPGPHGGGILIPNGGTNYVSMIRTTVQTERRDQLNAEFTVAVTNVGSVVHIEAWFSYVSGYIQMDLAGVPWGYGMFAMIFSPNGTVAVYNAKSVYVSSGFFSPPAGGWAKCELDYTLGATNITLTVDNRSVDMSVSPLGQVKGVLIGSGGPDSSAYVDDVLVKVSIPTGPRLDHSLNGNQLTLSWVDAGFVLQENSDLTNAAG